MIGIPIRQWDVHYYWRIADALYFLVIACFTDSFLFLLLIPDCCSCFQIRSNRWLELFSELYSAKKRAFFLENSRLLSNFRYQNEFLFHGFFLVSVLKTNFCPQIQTSFGQATIVCMKFSMAYSFLAKSLFLSLTTSKHLGFKGFFLTLIEFLFSRIPINKKIRNSILQFNRIFVSVWFAQI